MQTSTRDDLKKLVSQIESLAKNIQSDIDNSGPFLLNANELACKTLTMCFALGEVYAKELSKTPSKRVYLRDSKGRFARKQ